MASCQQMPPMISSESSRKERRKRRGGKREDSDREEEGQRSLFWFVVLVVAVEVQTQYWCSRTGTFPVIPTMKVPVEARTNIPRVQSDNGNIKNNNPRARRTQRKKNNKIELTELRGSVLQKVAYSFRYQYTCLCGESDFGYTQTYTILDHPTDQ